LGLGGGPGRYAGQPSGCRCKVNRPATWDDRTGTFQLRIPALDRAFDTILNHLYGILNAITLNTLNAASESVNSRVQALKKRANGYRNRARFRDAIYFHLGGLDLYPTRAFHSNS
jgi:transposase